VGLVGGGVGGMGLEQFAWHAPAVRNLPPCVGRIQVQKVADSG
jgi:hypothetical protein